VTLDTAAKVACMSLDRSVPPHPYEHLPVVPSFSVTSTDVADGAQLDNAHVFDGWGMTGGNKSPQLAWSGFPSETARFAVTCFDPDAPTPSGFWHWLVLGIPATVTELPRGAGDSDGSLPEGAFHVRNDFSTLAYGGAAPPQGDRPHRYVFAVHALDTADLGIDNSVSAAVAAFNLWAHTIARAVISPVWSY
jgi:Raf kinase inhibitor-like YbhB/YbcL family protein